MIVFFIEINNCVSTLGIPRSIQMYSFSVKPEHEDKISCGLKQGFNDGSTNTNTNALSSAAGKRRKRSASIEESKYGCPDGFQRSSQYMCLHYFHNMDNKGVRKNLNDSKTYCKTKDKNANLLYIDNADEASKIWDWLGEYDYLLFINCS